MLIVELNVAGYRLSGEWAGLRRNTLRPARFNPRAIQWRMPQLRHTPGRASPVPTARFRRTQGFSVSRPGTSGDLKSAPVPSAIG